MSNPNEESNQPDDELRLRQILRQRHREGSRRTICAPCRTRKVKCDKTQPCGNCRKRGYPELCSFTTQTRNQSGDASGATSRPPASPNVDRTDVEQARRPVTPSPTNDFPGSHASALSSVTSPGTELSDVSPLIGTIGKHRGQHEHFLGTNSIPSLLRHENSIVGLSSEPDTRKNSVQEAILPLMGLEGSRSIYPFLPTSQSSVERLEELQQALPIDREIIRLFQCYRQEVYPYSIIISDIETYELELCSLLETRSNTQQEPSQRNDENHGTEYQRSISWVGLLFAVLASGVQYCNDSIQRRQQKSQAYVRYSFQCLRMANFIARPSLPCIRTLLTLGHVLQNDMKPQAAWVLLGTTSRMAQSLGLHEERDITSPRAKLWQAVVWQDALLSLCFDRQPATIFSGIETPLDDLKSYKDWMIALSRTTISSFWRRATRNGTDSTGMLHDVNMIERIQSYSKSYFIEKSAASSIRERCESYALDLHISFVTAWLCRPALRRGYDAGVRADNRSELIRKCTSNLFACVRAFIKLNSLSVLARRSWAITHNGLSSILLLSFLDATARSPEVKTLQGLVLEIFSVETEMDANEKVDIDLSTPHARTLDVLKRLHSRSSNPEDAVQDDPGTSQADPEAADIIPMSSNELYTAESTYPFTDFSNYIDTGQSAPPQASELLNRNPSPLDMFDSIIWDPTGVSQSMLDYNTFFAES